MDTKTLDANTIFNWLVNGRGEAALDALDNLNDPQHIQPDPESLLNKISVKLEAPLRKKEGVSIYGDSSSWERYYLYFALTTLCTKKR